MFDFLDTFSDSTIYFGMGVIGSVLFGLRMLMMLIGGIDGDVDFDTDMGGDGGMASHGSGFGLFSMLSIISFMMGAGWLGLACRLEWEMGQLASALSAGGFGFFLMLISSVGMYQMRKLNEEGKYDVRNCIGKIGQVYMTIPAKGEGQGKVRVTFDGRQKILPAISTGESIESFTAVTVKDVQAQDTLIVEKQ